MESLDIAIAQGNSTVRDQEQACTDCPQFRYDEIDLLCHYTYPSILASNASSVSNLCWNLL